MKSFDIDVRVKNIKNAVEANFRVDWDVETIVDFDTNVIFSESFGLYQTPSRIGLLLHSFEDKLGTPFSIQDTTILIKLRFRANKVGQSYFKFRRFGSSYKETKIILDDRSLGVKETDIFIKERLLNVKARPNCYTGATEVKAFVCGDETYLYNDKSYKEGFYSIPFITDVGCDSVVLLRVRQIGSSGTRSATICNANTNDNFPKSGYYIDTLTTPLGCSSIKKFNVKVLPDNSCRAPIEILMADKKITTGESFCVEVTTKKFP